MTTSRIVRGTKFRIFLYVCAILIITGIIACYNNTLSQLEDARKSSEICHQQEENLSTQLQVISDYKQRLEKSLKNEKAEHQQEKNDLENKANEEKSKSEKVISEANVRFNTLQQHYNLLKTQFDDTKEEYSKKQETQTNEINDLQAKLKEVQEELEKVNSSKESLKTEYLQVKVEEDNLRNELETYKSQNNDKIKNEVNHLTKVNHDLQRAIEELKSKCSTFESIQAPNVPPDTPFLPQDSNNDILNENNQNQEAKANNVEMQDQQRNVLQSPPRQNIVKAPTKSTTSSSISVSQANLNMVKPLIIPTITPKSANQPSSPSNVLKLPEGVVPVPAPQKRDLEKKTDNSEKNELPDAINNRYRNKISETQLKEDARKNDEADRENGAHEIFDQPVHNGGAYDALGFGDLNDPIKNVAKPKQHIDNLGIGEKESNKLYNKNNKDNKNYEDDYKENQNDIQAEENEDDDADDYGDLGRIKDAVVRN